MQGYAWTCLTIGPWQHQDACNMYNLQHITGNIQVQLFVVFCHISVFSVLITIEVVLDTKV